MTGILTINSKRFIIRIVVILFALVMTVAPVEFGVGEQQSIAPLSPNPVFRPGESLTYSVSWSNIISAGTAVLEVENEILPEGRSVLAFTLTGHSTGLVETFYHVHDRAHSVFDQLIGQSLSYQIKEIYGKKTRRRDLVFDPERRTVTSILNDDAPETLAVPDHILDTLSALYRIRMMGDFTIGKISTINVFESGKNWSVEVQTLAREKVRTPAGLFDTIKIRTYPRYEGVFLNKGVAFLWLSDDNQKIPVLMRSSLKVGSFVFTLTDMKQGGEAQ